MRGAKSSIMNPKRYDPSACLWIAFGAVQTSKDGGALCLAMEVRCNILGPSL